MPFLTFFWFGGFPYCRPQKEGWYQLILKLEDLGLQPSHWIGSGIGMPKMQTIHPMTHEIPMVLAAKRCPKRMKSQPLGFGRLPVTV